MTADEPIKEIQDLEFQEEAQEVRHEIVPVRRGNQDVTLTMDGEVIHMPCYDVSLMQKRFRLEGHETERYMGNDRAKGTVNQLASIVPDCWNKQTRKDYDYKFSSNDPRPSASSNFNKFVCFLSNRMDAQQLVLQHLFRMNMITMDEDVRSSKYRISLAELRRTNAATKNGESNDLDEYRSAMGTGVSWNPLGRVIRHHL
jgi:hypothetical protein